MSAFTPGPWFVDGDRVVADGDGAEVFVAQVDPWGEIREAEGDAHLIAAAPDMLVALLALSERQAEWFAAKRAHYTTPNGTTSQVWLDANEAWADAWDLANAAIAKARNESLNESGRQ